MKQKDSYVPTRQCPHRWCNLLHMAPIPFLLAILAFYLWSNWLWLFLLAASATGAHWVGKMIHMRRRPRSGPVRIQHVIEDIKDAPTPIEMEMEDAKYAGTGWRVLEVRKGWARVAVGCDAFLLTVIGLSSVTLFSDPVHAAADAKHATSDMATYVSLLIGIAFFAFQAYAHKKATQPRKPKRAWLPAFLRTES